ncbi:MAG: ribosomal protection-like ABC-F family protein [Thermomicrobiales bacterium]
MLSANSLSKRFGDLPVLTDVSLIVNRRDRIGLIGPNGSGKSTLLSLLAGVETPDGGSITLAPGHRVGYLRQGFADSPGARLSDLLDASLGGLLAAHDAVVAVAAHVASGSASAHASVFAAFEAAGGYERLDLLATLLGRLGLPDRDWSSPLDRFSGMEKTRAGLAALLATGPDLLLLDEPTNHLDIDALDWLGHFVRTYDGAVVAVSHDRGFLDATVTSIAELDPDRGGLRVFPGDYSAYLAAKTAERDAHADAYERQRLEIARIKGDIRAVASHARETERQTQNDFLRGRAKKVARTAKVRERKLERLLASEQRIDKPERGWEMAVGFGAAAPTGRDAVSIDDATVAYGDRVVLRSVHLRIRSGDRVAVTGPNGAGKSTLLRMIAGSVAPSAGCVRLGAGVVIGEFAQEQESVDPTRSALAQVRALAEIDETDARTFLHRFLFGGDSVLRPAGDLSYGERARLALALVVRRGANVLLLDEPFNHLDLPSRENFEAALTTFGGTLLMVLHDRSAIARLATRTLEVRDGLVVER